MSNFPDFSRYGYQVETELGQNRTGGRVTYKAFSSKTQQSVVIKQFQFAQSGANWSEYQAHQQEIKLLQKLNHPSIPRYLDCFETSAGFCLVQDYKHAPSLAHPRQFTPLEIKQIAIALLEVLVYLQQQYPPIIHRDIKPENILVDQQMQVYLVDFGFARAGGGQVAASSAIKGTLGFMPPEQLFNRQLTTASDLYGLGATLICLLTNTKSTEIGNLIDETYSINFKPLVTQLNPQFINWLEKMVAPSLKNRFDNALAALESLKSIEVNRARVLASPMKPKTIAAALLLTSLCFMSAIAIPNFLKQGRVARLLETKQCPECDLSDVNLEGADLEGANLVNANLANAKLRGAQLQGAKLRGAELRAAQLQGANLQGAKLRGADLQAADLNGAYLGCDDVSFNLDANDEGANLSFKLGNDVKVNLNASDRGVNFGFNMDDNSGCADLRGANLQDATMPDGSIHD
jgi:uncharacterized protein YjbI with pentapeptide repeats